MIIATAGHVDHGKTSLVKALTGVDTDRLEEEKARGLTINLGFAYRDAETGGRLGFVDVPGHIRFINNMLAGIAAVDFALLAVAADDGIMPQTSEHVEILDLLGIRQGAVALTKIDRVENARVELVAREVEELLAQTSLAGSDIYPVSTMTGEGMDTLLLALDIAADDREERNSDGLFRLAIDRRFNVKGSGIVVTGSVFSGTATLDDELFLMPRDIPVRVRSIHTQDRAAGLARAGERCAMNIVGNRLRLDDIHRGNWVTGNRAKAMDRFDARVRVLGSAEKPLDHWAPVHLHTAANHLPARVAVLEHGSIAPGQEGLTQVVLSRPINVCVGDRLVIRDQSAKTTLAGGRVLAPMSPRRGRAKPERVALLNAIDVDSAEVSLRQCLQARPTGVSTRDFALAFNLADEGLLKILPDKGVTRLDDNHLISDANFDRHLAALTSGFDEWHKNNAGSDGMPSSQLKSLFCRSWPGELANRVLGTLLEQGQLEQAGNIIRRPGFRAQLDDRAKELFGLVAPLIKETPARPPVLHQLAQQVRVAPGELSRALDQAVKVGLLLRPVKNRYFTPVGIAELEAALADVSRANRRFTVQHYRDRTGIGRNLSIKILEYFDRKGITRRIGNERELVDRQKREG